MLLSRYYLTKAKRQLALANHLWSVTYPLTQEPKIFLAIIQRLKNACTAAIQAVVVHNKEKYKKEPKNKPTTKQIKQLFFKYQFSQCYLKQYTKLSTLLEQYRQSPVVFQRKGALIICKDHYKKLHLLSSESIKNYLVLIDQFIKAVERKCDVRRNTRKSA
jgi:hypothetical protein